MSCIFSEIYESFIAMATVVLLAALLTAAVEGQGGAQQTPAQAGGEPPGTADRQIKAQLAKKAQRTPAQRKVSSQLLDAQRAANARRQAKGEFVEDELVTVDIRSDVTPAVLARIRALGGTVINSVGRSTGPSGRDSRSPPWKSSLRWTQFNRSALPTRRPRATGRQGCHRAPQRARPKVMVPAICSEPPGDYEAATRDRNHGMGRCQPVLGATESGAGNPAAGRARRSTANVGAGWRRVGGEDRAANRGSTGCEGAADARSEEGEFAAPARAAGTGVRCCEPAGAGHNCHRRDGDGGHPGRRHARGAGTHPGAGRHDHQQRRAVPGHPGEPPDRCRGTAGCSRGGPVDPPRRRGGHAWPGTVGSDPTSGRTWQQPAQSTHPRATSPTRRTWRARPTAWTARASASA